ncbi:MRN complex-interacting protein [Bienertia sinuspersici]
MFKSTLFIAVKQQKKSSNKWNCVVCNQKQSVTKIYAQSYQAKDIRNVVQSFNMSRKFEDEALQQEDPSLGHFVEQLGGAHETQDNNNNIYKGKRRTDWSEYMDDYESVELEPGYLKSKLNEMAAEVKVVTEFPEDFVLKKPRLKGNFGSSSLDSSMNQSYKPNFSKRVSTKEVMESGSRSTNIESMWDECIGGSIRDARKRQCEQQQQPYKVLTMAKSGGSKQSQYMRKDDFHKDIERQLQKQDKGMAMMKASVSKWSEYVKDDDYNGGDKDVKAPAFADDLRLVCGYEPENYGVIDQQIEEEIHPDFL